MLHYHLKLPTGGAAVLLAFLLLRACAVQAASLPRYHRLRGGESEAPLAAYPSSSDMQKALEYIENLKQGTGAREMRPVDVDKMERSRVQVELASRLQEAAGERQPPAAGQRQAVSAEQLLEALVKYIQDLVGREAKTAAAAPRSDRRAYRHRPKEAGSRGNAPADYDNFPRPHKKYPLMFEDEENRDAYKRATEDLDEQYTPQSLANLRSIFEELGRMPTTTAINNGQKRGAVGDDDADDDDDDEEMLNLRNLAYEDVTGGEDWVPVEEKEEAEEMVNRSHEEVERGLGEFSEQQEADNEDIQRRASPDQEDADDDTKLVDYYLLKVLEMSDQTQKRDTTAEQRKRLIRPSIVDPRTVKELLELSLKLHVPPQDLINTLITEEFRKLRRRPQASAAYTPGQAPAIRYYSRRLPLKAKSAPEDMDREDFLDIIGVETISNEYPVMQRPAKPASSPDRAAAPPAPAPAANSAAPVKIPPPAGRRENLFLSELNKMPLKRQAARDDEDDDDVEDEVTTYLAAKILTEYPNTISKRDTLAQRRGQFPYELYEQALQDYLHGQADADKGPVAKRETESATEPARSPATDDAAAKTSARPRTTDDDNNADGGEEEEEAGEEEEEARRRRGNPM